MARVPCNYVPVDTFGRRPRSIGSICLRARAERIRARAERIRARAERIRARADTAMVLESVAGHEGRATTAPLTPCGRRPRSTVSICLRAPPKMHRERVLQLLVLLFLQY